MNIWILTTGLHSESRIVGVFDDEYKEKAGQLAELLDEGYIEEIPFRLNEFEHDLPPPGKLYFGVEVDRKGKTTMLYNSSPLKGDGKLKIPKYQVHTNNPYRHKHYWRLRAAIFARDRDHAVEIINEIRIGILAETLPGKGNLDMEGYLIE